MLVELQTRHGPAWVNPSHVALVRRGVVVTHTPTGPENEQVTFVFVASAERILTDLEPVEVVALLTPPDPHE